MPEKEVLLRKLEQIEELLGELDDFIGRSFSAFMKEIAVLRAAERNFQLIVDIASDVNAQMLVMRGKATPDTYKQTFMRLGREGVLPERLVRQLVEAAKVRNILVHEYDFEEDYHKFYTAARRLIPVFREYTKRVHDVVKGKK